MTGTEPGLWSASTKNTGVMLTDREMWDSAVAAVRLEYAALSAPLRREVAVKVSQIRSLKGEIHSFAAGLDGAAICAACLGECCAKGKHHFTVADLLVFIASGEPLFAPAFSSGLCPYLGDGGCLMGAEFRPFNCIIFNCDRIEGLMEPAALERFSSLEKALRMVYMDMEQLFGNRFMSGLLMNYERDVLVKGTPILKRKA